MEKPEFLGDIKEKLHRIKGRLTGPVADGESTTDQELGKKADNSAEAAGSSANADNWRGTDYFGGSWRKKAAIGAGVLLCACLLLLGILSSTYSISPVTEVESQEKVAVRIAPGMGSNEIGQLLEEQGVIDSSLKFRLAVRLNNAAGKFQVGTFELAKNMPVGDVLGVLINGHSVAMRVTVPEGLNVREVARLMAENGLAEEDDFLKAARSFVPFDYIEVVPEADYPIEGFLFPDTYEFATDASPEDIMQKMAEEFDRKLTPELRQQAAERSLSIYELVTMASLVEKEARYAEDRPIIAQVFFKRMDIGMPLQTDTTLQYLREEVKEDLSIADTRVESPYNTYLNYGLPPGPIASPGLSSLEAVLKPADTDYLYFVADREGHNHYSYSYEEHLALVDQVR